MQGIDREIAGNYGLEVRGVAPYKDTYIITTSKGKLLIKKMLFSSERILFIHGAKEHLFQNGFTRIDRYYTTVNGDPYFSFDGFNHVLYDFVEGRECNFENDEEVIKAAEALASLHVASKGFVIPKAAKVQDDLGNLAGNFNKRLDDIKKLKKHAKRGNSRFDQLFLEHADYFINLGENTISNLEHSNYSRLVEKARSEGVFCHHDYTYHNIITVDDALWVMNFDYCCLELRIYDLANLIRRKMRKCDWNFDKAKLLIDGYNSIEELSTDEMAVMKLLLLFPQKFWRVVNKYYNSRRSWSEKNFISKLQEVIDEVDGHRRFIDRYDSLMQ